MLDRLSIFTGNAHPELAQAVCRYLGVPLGRAEVFEFDNENIFVRIIDLVREQDVFVVQPTCSPVNRSVMELLIMIDALKRASAGRITAVVPYYSYARTDKKDQPRVPITARLIADCITVAGANRMLTMDLHAGQIQGFFSIPVDELTARYTLSQYFKHKHLPAPVIVAADTGIAKGARYFAEILDAPLAIVEKRRVGNTGKAEALNLIGDVEGRQAIIFDDEVNSGGSMIEAAGVVLKGGAKEVYAASTHGVFSGQAAQRIASSLIKEMVVTDTIPLRVEKQVPNISVLSVASLFGEAIRRIHTGASIGACYEVVTPHDGN